MDLKYLDAGEAGPRTINLFFPWYDRDWFKTNWCPVVAACDGCSHDLSSPFPLGATRKCLNAW